MGLILIQSAVFRIFYAANVQWMSKRQNIHIENFKRVGAPYEVFNVNFLVEYELVSNMLYVLGF